MFIEALCPFSDRGLYLSVVASQFLAISSPSLTVDAHSSGPLSGVFSLPLPLPLSLLLSLSSSLLSSLIVSTSRPSKDRLGKNTPEFNFLH